jgi:hypothetical protein
LGSHWGPKGPRLILAPIRVHAIAATHGRVGRAFLAVRHLVLPTRAASLPLLHLSSVVSKLLGP